MAELSVEPVGAARFSTADIVEADRLAVWREVFGRQLARLDLEPMDSEKPYLCELTGLALPGLALSTCTYDNVRSRRSPDLTTDGNDDVMFALVDGGAGRLSRPGRDEAFLAGQCALTNNSIVNFTAEAPQTLTLTNFVLPRANLAPLVANIDDISVFNEPASAEVARLLRQYSVELTAARARPFTEQFQVMAVNHMTDLIVLAVGASGEAREVAAGRGLRAARLQAMKSDLNQNLGLPELSADWLAHRHGVSPGYVRKLFELGGLSVSAFVLEARLRAAHRALSRPGPLIQGIGATALDVGFGDISYFNRAFRRRFGETPSSLRKRATL